jgi:hypothetical protein
MKMWWLVLAGLLSTIGCSSSPSSGKQDKTASTALTKPAGAKNSNPMAKFIELVGFRINEKSPGHLQVQFGVVNHSEADIGDLKMDVSLQTTAAKPGDPPLLIFSAKVPALGPSELKQVTVEVPSKLRVYELPDWQFLKADFQITEPQ